MATGLLSQCAQGKHNCVEMLCIKNIYLPCTSSILKVRTIHVQEKIFLLQECVEWTWKQLLLCLFLWLTHLSSARAQYEENHLLWPCFLLQVVIWVYNDLENIVQFFTAFFLVGEQQRPRRRSIHRLSPPAGERNHKRQGSQSKEGVPLSSTHPSPHPTWRQRTGGNHLQSW